MTLLIFEPSKPKRSGPKKPLKFILGIGALAGTIALGSTLAASINLNDNGPVEFGQGVTQTVACDSEVEVTPNSSFVNSEGGGDFKFSSITLSDLDGTDQAESSEGCAGKSFTIKAYDAYGEQLQPTYGLSVDANGNFFSLSGDTDGTDEGAENSSVTLSFSGGILTSAESVYRITVESENLVYEVGDTGPGNGIVFYYSEAGFSCGPTLSSSCNYLEAAPGDWNDGDDPQISWSTGENQDLTVTGADNESIGSGYKNSLDIANQSGNLLATTAALVARGHDGGGKSDWYLPSKGELDTLFTQKALVGGFTASNYWSSTEVFNNGGWNQNFSTREQGENGKFDARSVRPIRAF